jgi:hypothetical protein
MPVKKLAGFMDVADAELDSFVGKLLTFKMITNELGKETVDRLEGALIDDFTNDLDFYVDRVTID